MLTLKTQRYIKFAKREYATYWAVAAIAVEERGGVVTFVSEPRVIRIIAKQAKHLALGGYASQSKGSKASKSGAKRPFALVEGSLPVRSVVGVRSPFFHKNHLYTEPAFAASLYARPPTA